MITEHVGETLITAKTDSSLRLCTCDCVSFNQISYYRISSKPKLLDYRWLGRKAIGLSQGGASPKRSDVIRRTGGLKLNQ